MGADVSARPPDEEHAFGHSKAEYFSSGLGALILIAAASISVAAWDRLLSPQPLEQVGLGLGLTLVASAINGGVALILLRAGRRLRSTHCVPTRITCSPDFGWRVLASH